MDDESERREKKSTMVSKSGTTTDFLTGGGTAGATDANSVHYNNYSTHNHGWIGVGERERQIYVV